MVPSLRLLCVPARSDTRWPRFHVSKLVAASESFWLVRLGYCALIIAEARRHSSPLSTAFPSVELCMVWFLRSDCCACRQGQTRDGLVSWIPMRGCLGIILASSTGLLCSEYCCAQGVPMQTHEYILQLSGRQSCVKQDILVSLRRTGA